MIVKKKVSARKTAAKALANILQAPVCPLFSPISSVKTIFTLLKKVLIKDEDSVENFELKIPRLPYSVKEL